MLAWVLLAAIVYGADGRCALPAPENPLSASWILHRWDGDDRPYAKLEQTIDERIAHGEAMPDLINEYQTQAENEPSSPEAQFAWAYSAYRYNETVHGIVNYPVLHALMKSDPENVYSYTRLRFIVTRMALPNNYLHSLQPLGSRLLYRRPNDEAVHKNLVYALCTSSFSVQEALRIATKWVQGRPAEPGPHAVLAFVEQTMFDFSKGTNRASMTAAVAEYQQYLRLAPPQDAFRKHASLMIRVLPTEKPW